MAKSIPASKEPPFEMNGQYERKSVHPGRGFTIELESRKREGNGRSRG